ncbi:Uncharacterized protein QTN25_007197 [Entamoeba marina]
MNNNYSITSITSPIPSINSVDTTNEPSPCSSPNNTDSSKDSSKSISNESNDDSDNLKTTTDDDDNEEEDNSSEFQSEDDNGDMFNYPEFQSNDIEVLYKEKCKEVIELQKQNQILKNKQSTLEKQLTEHKEMIGKLININEQIMRDKEMIFYALNKMNDEKNVLETQLKEFKYSHFTSVDTNINMTSPTKDVKVVHISFDKYLFVKYTTTRPLGVICMFPESKPANVINSYTYKTAELGVDEYHYFQPNNRGQPLRVKDGDQVLSLTENDNQIITISPLPPIFDDFHKVIQVNSWLNGKKQYYMTVVDLSTVKKESSVEIKAFGVMFESDLKGKTPGSVDLYDDYLDLFRQINKGVVISFVESIDMSKSLTLNQTREIVVKPESSTSRDVFYVESKTLKLPKFNIPYLFPVPYKDQNEPYCVAFYVTQTRDTCHVIEVV